MVLYFQSDLIYLNNKIHFQEEVICPKLDKCNPELQD